LTTLNPEQQQAVDYDGGPLLLLAGAGSGKTRVITQRVVAQIEKGVSPDSILAVTFTNRAAKEMAERIDRSLQPEQRSKLVVSTFHALGARILRAHGAYFHRSQGFAIYDSDDQKSLVKRLLKAEGRTTTAAELNDAIRQVARWKSQRATGEAESLPLGVQYEAELRASNAFDFDDLILKTLLLLTQDADLRARYQRRWQHVCVDEFQDTNDAQYGIIRCLCPKGTDLLVVGDDDQSIYGWRGAKVGNILAFNQDYPSAQTIRLERNYRSTAAILAIANRVIANNETRLGKELWTDRKDEDSVQVREFSSQRDEAEFVAGEILTQRRRQKGAWSDFAVLVRANHLSLDFETVLRSYHIPYKIVRGRSFYERAEIRDALSVLRASVNPDDTNALLRILSRCVRGVGKKSLEILGVSSRANDCSLWQSVQDEGLVAQIRGPGRAAIKGFVDQMSIVVDMSVIDSKTHYDGLRACLRAFGILDEGRLDSRDEQERQRAENVVRLMTEIQTWIENNVGVALAEYLEQTALVSDVDALDDDQNTVSIMTVHASKGLEFPVVFVVALEEDVFPHARSKMEGDVEEERRLFYVAVTRAMNRVYLSRARMRRTFADVSYQRPSRFLREIELEPGVDTESETSQTFEHENTDWLHDTVEAPQYRIGQSVWHGQYGEGTVANLSKGKTSVVTVRFPGIGQKKILADFLSPYGTEGQNEW
jgi:DNA helicase II / ATP-dependent DNA helicase PcrA